MIKKAKPALATCALTGNYEPNIQFTTSGHNLSIQSSHKGDSLSICSLYWCHSINTETFSPKYEEFSKYGEPTLGIGNNYRQTVAPKSLAQHLFIWYKSSVLIAKTLNPELWLVDFKMCRKE